MLTFKEFIIEERSSERAHKLLTYIHKRTGKDSIRIKSFNKNSLPDHVNNWLIDADYPASTKSSLKHISIKDIVVGQGDVDGSHVKSMMSSKHLKTPIDVLRYKGTYHVTDGHHRLFAHKLMGHKTIMANVVDADKADVT